MSERIFQRIISVLCFPIVLWFFVGCSASDTTVQVEEWDTNEEISPAGWESWEHVEATEEGGN